MFWVIISGRESVHSVETAYTSRENSSFCTSGYNDVRFS